MRAVRKVCMNMLDLRTIAIIPCGNYSCGEETAWPKPCTVGICIRCQRCSPIILICAYIIYIYTCLFSKSMNAESQFNHIGPHKANRYTASPKPSLHFMSHVFAFGLSTRSSEGKKQASIFSSLPLLAYIQP